MGCSLGLPAAFSSANGLFCRCVLSSVRALCVCCFSSVWPAVGRWKFCFSFLLASASGFLLLASFGFWALVFFLGLVFGFVFSCFCFVF